MNGKYLAPILAVALALAAPCSLRAGASGPKATAKTSAAARQRDKYQKQVEAKLRELDRETARLKAQAPRQRRELRKEFDEQMAELDQKRQAAQKQLEKFEGNSQHAWRDAKPSLDAAMKNLEKAYQRAASDFK